MTRHEISPSSTRNGGETAVSPPSTLRGFAPFVLLPVATVLALSFPVTAVAAVGGAALATLHHRLRTARPRADTGTTTAPAGLAHDV